MTENTKAKKKELELRELEANVKKAEADAEKALLELDDTKHAYAWSSLNKASRTGVFYFDEIVDHTSVSYMTGQLRRYSKLNPKAPIEIVLNTPGGQVIQGLALFDEIRTLSEVHGHEVTTRVRGYAASMGAVLLQAGDKRIVGAESYIMIHEISSGSMGKLHEMENDVETSKMLNKRLFDIMARRTGGRYTGTKLYAKAKAKDVWISAKEAVEDYGLADEIG